MNSSEKELEEQLKEIGNELLNPPSSIDALLKALDVRICFFFLPPFLLFLYASCYA